MNRYSWKWYKEDLCIDKDVKVFSTFSCGGGSSMGYKRAGFDVIGNVEIDPKMNDLYITNHHPKYNYCQDLREFNKREDLPDELIGIDILDGSPPCTSFSTAGTRAQNWGKAKRFKEGQNLQVLDDLFFVFLDTVEKLQPKIVVAENVVGLTTGKAKGYVNLIIKRFMALGYDVQIFSLNSAFMDCPQARPRVFFIANKCGYKKLHLNFQYDPIMFKEIRSEHGVDVGGDLKTILEYAQPSDRYVRDIAKRMLGKSKYYTTWIVNDNTVCPTITSSGQYIRYYDRKLFSNNDVINAQTFPQDYNFKKQSVQYVCGMSVPPNMMANIATEIYEQWLR